MSKKLNDLMNLKSRLENIKKISNDQHWDKKYWSFSKEYSSDFGLFKVSYTAGTYGSSSVSNQLSSIEDPESKRIFTEFMLEKMPSLMDEFLIFFENKLRKEANEKIKEYEKNINQLKKDFSLESK